jgi:hypothetical protein
MTKWRKTKGEGEGNLEKGGRRNEYVRKIYVEFSARITKA